MTYSELISDPKITHVMLRPAPDGSIQILKKSSLNEWNLNGYAFGGMTRPNVARFDKR